MLSVLSVGLALGIAGCGSGSSSEPVTPPPAVAALMVISGGGGNDTIGVTLPQLLTVEVRRPNADLARGVTVRFLRSTLKCNNRRHGT